MQDKFSIGPVTFVQLVALTAKPRIASAQADGAVRAADSVPPSAAAGLGDDLSHTVNEIASSYLNLKSPPPLELSADPIRGHISIEAGVDRPVAETFAPVPVPEAVAIEKFLPENILRDPSIGQRTDLLSPDVAIADEVSLTFQSSEKTVFFDGSNSFGDDQILDFTTNIEIQSFVQSFTNSMQSNDEIEEFASVADVHSWDGFSIIDCSGGVSPEPQLTNNDFIPPEHIVAITGAIPPI